MNEIGEGPIGNEVVIFSAEEMPMAIPEQVVALQYNSSSLNVTWRPIEETRENVRGKLIGYRVKIF